MKSYCTIFYSANDQFLVDVFEDGLVPNNANIDKGRTGNGITTAEIEARRNSIIVNPQLITILDKTTQSLKRKLNIISISSDEESENDRQILDFLLGKSVNKKIFVTPESFPRLMTIAKQNDLEELIRSTFFLLLDEVHCYLSDSFRDKILKPFDYFFSFKNKAMATATAVPFTDPRIESLEQIKIIYPNLERTVEVIYGKDPKSILVKMIEADRFKGNVHVFFNSVSKIGDIVRAAKLRQCSIYCAEKPENRAALGEEVKFMINDTPQEVNRSKINFYTSRCAEGFDMFDNNSTVIFLTDTTVKHSLISIPVKGVQSFGRVRKPKGCNYMHITNSMEMEHQFLKSYNEVKESVFTQATALKMFCADLIQELYLKGSYPERDILKLVNKYCDIDAQNVKINSLKCDQLIFKYCTEAQFNTLESILIAWKNCGYSVKFQITDVPSIVKARTKAERNRMICEYLKSLQQSSNFNYASSDSTFYNINKDYVDIINAYFLLPYEELEDCEFDNNLIKAKLNMLHNNNMLPHLLKRLNHIKIGEKYTREYLKKLLNDIYKELNILDAQGSLMKAKATDLGSKLWNIFEIKDCRITDEGVRKSGFLISSRRMEFANVP